MNETEKIIEQLETVIKDEMIMSSFVRNNLKFIESYENNIYIGFNDEVSKNSVKYVCFDDVVSIVKKVLKSDTAIVNFVINGEYKKKGFSRDGDQIPKHYGLIPKYTFDNFYELNSNREVVTGLKKVVNDFGIFKTFVIVGKSGLGKTHLLNAIGNLFLEKNKSVLLINPNHFTERFVKYSTSKSMNLTKMKEEFLQYDVFLVDDFQLFKKRERSQEFFLDIYESFLNMDKQLIFCIDSQINKNNLIGFSEKLKNRLLNSVNLIITKPSQNDLVVVLKKLLHYYKINFEHWEDDIFDFLIRNSEPNISSIEGKVKKIAFHTTEGSSFNLKKIKHIFASGAFDKESLTSERIINVVAKYYQVSKNVLISKSRQNNLVFARDVTYYFLRKLLNISYQEIGSFFSNRNHSTILNGIKKIEKKIKENNFLISKSLKIIENKIYKYE